MKSSRLLLLLILPMMFFMSQNVLGGWTVDPEGRGTSEVKPSGYFNQNTILGTSIVKVISTHKGTNVTFWDPFRSENRQVWAGTFIGDLNGSTAKFYCVDFTHPLAFYKESAPHTYTDDAVTPPEITYVLNNYYPFKVNANALIETKEAAAVQIALWHFADGIDANTVVASDIKARALAIINDANQNSMVTVPVQTLAITPIIQYQLVGSNGTFSIVVKDASGNPVSGVTVTLAASSGTLGAESAVTNSQGVAGPISITKGATNNATITATANVVMPHGTRYVHTIEPNSYQKIVLATPASYTRTVEGQIFWNNTGTNCDLNGYITYTQGGWGSPGNSTPGGIRDQYFPMVFPNGMVLGIGNTITLTSAGAVKDFLPQGGTAGPLTGSYVNPVDNTEAGVLGGQIGAMTMSVYFSAAGYLGNNSTPIGNLVIVSGPFVGKTVMEFLTIANTALGGGTTGYTYSQINDAATAFNENFDNGTVNNDFLACREDLPISPILECVVNNGDGTYTAHFGYNNPNAYDVTIPIGTRNKFNGANSDLGQPTVFKPGRTPYFPSAEFQVVFDGTNLVWTLDGRTSTASANTQPCSEHVYFEKKWYDVDGNELSDMPDNIPANYTITVTSTLGVATGTVQGGEVVFTYVNNPPALDNNGLWVPLGGTYTVQEFNLPEGYAAWEGVGSFISEIPGGCAINPYDGLDKNGLHTIKNKEVLPARLGDRVWFDTNQDGVQGGAEHGASGIEVKLYDCTGNFKASTYTNTEGYYLFDNLMPGDYYVSFTLPANYQFTLQDAGGDDALDSDVDAATGRTICTTLEAGEEDLTWDAGIYAYTASLGDYVWHDLNQDGVQDDYEPGVEGVVVNLYDCANTFIGTTTTDEDGYYLFDNLLAGDYHVEFVLPEHYSFSPMDQGGNDLMDSDADQTTGATVCTTLSPGENDMTWDAGIIHNNDADLRLRKTINRNTAKDGEFASYTILVTNDGPNSTDNVSVIDLIPGGLVYTNSSATQGSYDFNTGIWTVGTLGSGESASLTIEVQVDVEFVYGNAFDLGPAKGFNAFILYDMTCPSSDTEGKVAVGRHANFGGYSIGDKLPNSNGTVDVLVVGRDLYYSSGRVYNGNVVYGGSTNLPIYPVSIEEGTLRQGTPIDFDAARTYLRNLSDQLSLYPVNGTVVFEWTELFLTGAHPILNVFDINGSDLQAASNMEITVPNGSVVLVNIRGNNISWHGGLVVHGTSTTNVIYNFYQAENLTFSGIDITGTTLAPRADLNFPAGLHSGQLIVKSFVGSGQINNYNFIGNVPQDTTIVNVAEVYSSSRRDPDSTPNNGDDEEDDYGIVPLLVTNYDINSPDGNMVWNPQGTVGAGEMVWALVGGTGTKTGTMFAGTSFGNIYSSNDEGGFWTKINEGMNVSSIWALTEVENGAMLAGTDRGLFRLAAGTTSWVASGLVNQDVRSIVTGVNGTLFAATWSNGVYKSVDNGATWSPVNDGLTNLDVQDISIDENGDMYAATFGSGVALSMNGGQSWIPNTFMPQHVWTVAAINGVVLAGTYGNGVYRSDDHGATWTKVGEGVVSEYIYSIVSVDSKIYVNTFNGGVYESDDNGATWKQAGMMGKGVSSILAGTETGILFAGTQSGTIFKAIDQTTGVDDNESGAPTEFTLSQNYPNPFNPTTTINYTLPAGEFVTLKVYDILGAEVATLVNGQQVAGRYNVAFDAGRFASGVYIYRLQAGRFTEVRKMMLLK